MLNHKMAVVTGASRGIGRAIALELARQGAAVALVYRGSHEAARAVESQIIQSGGTAASFACDISDFSAVGLLCDEITERFSCVDIHSFDDLGVKRRNYVHIIASGHGGATIALESGNNSALVKNENRRDVKVCDIEHNIVQSAIARNPFFTFEKLRRYFPNLASMRDFIASENYLGELEITFQGNLDGLDDNHAEKLAALLGLLSQIESEIRSNVTDYEGTLDFKHDWVHKVFKDKVLKFDANTPRAKDDAQFEHFVSAKDWFAFNTLYGTSEEKAFVRMLDRQMQKLQAQYDEIYLLRNEGHFAIYNFSDGQAFQPDFVLFLREKGGNLVIYQLFIEPKGEHLKEHDRWKEIFLKEITNKFGGKQLILGDKKYLLIGVPFYNSEDENQFKENLESALETKLGE